MTDEGILSRAAYIPPTASRLPNDGPRLLGFSGHETLAVSTHLAKNSPTVNQASVRFNVESPCRRILAQYRR